MANVSNEFKLRRSTRMSKTSTRKSKTPIITKAPILVKKKICETLGNKVVCADVTQGEKLEIHDRKKCRERDGDASWMNLLKDNMCAKFEPYLTDKVFLDLDIEEKAKEETSSDLAKEKQLLTVDEDFEKLKDESMRLFGSFHHVSSIAGNKSITPEMKWSSTEPRKDEPYIDGNYHLPDRKPANEINFMGALGPAVGHPRSKTKIERPTLVQIIHNMRHRNQPIFTFGEDPKEANCCVKKIVKRDLTSPNLIKTIVDNVRIADNINTPPPSEISEEPTEIFDGDNPTNLDFQGFDSKETYQNDEQDIQNRREYFMQKRFMDKYNLKAELNYELEEKSKQEKYGLPTFFNVKENPDGLDELQDEEVIIPDWKDSYFPSQEKEDPHFERPIPEAIPFVQSAIILAHLTRTADKKKNIIEMNDIVDKRRERFEQRLTDKWEKDAAEKKEKEKQAKIDEENKVFTLGEKDFEDFFKDDYKEILNKYNELQPIYKEQKHPHTLREVKTLHKKMNLYKREVRDKARIKDEFLESINKKRYLKDTQLKVPDDLDENNLIELSEQSSDDEDGLSIGRKTHSKYQLRGFKYKLDMEPRGKFDVKHKTKEDRPLRTCKERMQWFDELAPEAPPNIFFTNNPSSIPCKAMPTEENYIIFQKERYLPKAVDISPIKEVIDNPLQEPAITDPKQLKLKKPKYIKVKKFNLTGFLYGTMKLRKPPESKYAGYNKYGVPYHIIEKCDENFENRQNMLRRKRINRMRVLGIPYEEYDYTKKESEKDDTDTDSDWVPDVEEESEEKDDMRGVSVVTLGRSNYPNSKPMSSFSISYMRAPKFREPTLREHPRRKRVWSHTNSPTINTDFSQNNHICSSKISTDCIKLRKTSSLTSINSRSPFDVPRMQKLAEDEIFSSNLDMPATDFTDLFNGRHHHYHYDHTQHKNIFVNYAPKIPKFTPYEKKKKIHRKLLPFQKANPRGFDPNELRVDKSLPMIRYIEITGKNDDHFYNKKNREESQDEDDKVEETSKKQFLNAAPKKTRKSYQETTSKDPFKKIILDHYGESKIDWGGETDEAYEYAKKNEYLETLKAEEESIKSCYSSEASSVHTNFTKDSGSFLMLQNRKVPCDYITKSYVPFEEVERSRIKAGPLEQTDEYYGPYYTVPFSGQKLDMKEITKPKDKFFTSLVRSRFGIRNRLKVTLPLVNDELIGGKQHKFITRLATEWDNYYQHEIQNRPRTKKFKPRSIIELSRNTLRKKFETMFIKEAITEQSIVHAKEIQFAHEVEDFQKVCLPLFISWEETYYRRSMRKMQDLKPYLERTDLLKKELNEIQKQETKVNMTIVYLEDDWIRRTRLQNFHYLIMKQKWREENDWIHRKSDGSLENFRESIQNRATTNIRVRRADNAWAVKEFYENYYLKMNRPIDILFPDTASFMRAIVRLKMRSYMCLVELHFSMWVLANLSHGYYSFETWATNYIDKRTKYVKSRCAKKYFMQDRASSLEEDGKRLMDTKLYDCISLKLMRTIVPLCDTVFLEIIPANIRGDLKEDSTIIDKFGLVVNCVLQILGELDKLPSEISRGIEEKSRKKRSYLLRQSERACALENRIELVMTQMTRNMGPPFIKPKRVGKLERSYYAPKKRVIKEIPVVIPSKALLFLDAFTDETMSDAHIEGAEAIEILKSIEDNCIPFYFDHFLKLHDYFPNYDFQTQIQMREGSEESRFFYQDVVEDVLLAVERWEQRREKQMNEQIKKTWYLYVDEDM